jgi:hypothetical protein
MITDDIYLKILRSAVKAPSGHNTQPWFFSKADDGICIKPDFKRALPVADPEHRELYISLGCAAETAMIAARFYGYMPALQINALNVDCPIKISLLKDDTIEQPELFSYMASRQTTRNLYENKLIPVEDIEKLKTTISEEGVTIQFYTEPNEIQKFSPFIAEANAMQMGNPKFKSELIQWMRFSEKEAMQKGDGLYTACSGVPSMGRVLGRFVLKNFVTAKSEEKRLLKQLDSTSALVMFTSQVDDLELWIKTGMAFQRFVLITTKLNLSHSYLNLPCQIPQVRIKMISELGLKGEYPQLLVRLGYSKKMHYSFRRRIKEVLVNSLSERVL